MAKLWAIAYKDIRTRFTDRTLLIIMLAAPLAISTIIGLVFGGLGSSTSPIQHIPVAVINYDQPSANGATFGALLAALLTTGELPSASNASLAQCPGASSQGNGSPAAGGITLSELIDGTTFDQARAQQLVADGQIAAPSALLTSPDYLTQAAHAAVDKGLYTALVFIPSGFSTALTSLADPRQVPATATLTVYGNAGRELSAGIVRSVVDSITSQLVSGNVAIGATLGVIAAQQPQLLPKASSLDFSQDFVCAFSPGDNLVKLDNLPVQATPTNTAGALLVSFGSVQALFFALFTGQFGILSMYDERKEGTLQRILVSPTPRWIVLGGKLVGVLVSVLFQLLILIFALTLVGSLIEGKAVFIWGTDLPRLGLLLLAVGVVTSGFGMFLAGVLKDVQQANVVGPVLNIALGVLGGGFGFQLPRSVAQFSFIYWGRDAFDILAAGHGDVSLNILLLFIEGAIFFIIGLLIFNRKFEV
jgi:ABC-type Na+ efflux pump permease subunit